MRLPWDDLEDVPGAVQLTLGQWVGSFFMSPGNPGGHLD
jgi:hypothetical protein